MSILFPGIRINYSADILSTYSIIKRWGFFSLLAIDKMSSDLFCEYIK